MKTVRIAHISDLHILDLEGTPWHQFLNKRLTGVVNLAGMRRNAHPVNLCEQLADHLGRSDLDHIIVTGDLTNLALDSEFRRARAIIERIGSPSRVTLIPGNHDLYTRGALRHKRFEKWFSEYLVDDDQDHHSAKDNGRLHYPFVRKLAPHVRVYGLSSAVPTLPMLAYGRVGKAQLARLRALVADEPPEVKVRIVLVHHNLHHRIGMAEYVATLTDRHAFSEVMHEIAATAVLHGHTHQPHQGHLTPRQDRVPSVDDEVLERGLADAVRDIPVIGCGSSTWHRDRKEHARFNVLEVGENRIIGVHSYRYTAAAGAFELEHQDLLDKALLAQRLIRV